MEEPALQNATLLVYANKQDMHAAMPAQELMQSLNLKKLRQKWYIQPCSAATGQGLYEGLDWLAQNIQS